MQPSISIGILFAGKINFSFNGNYFFENVEFNGTQTVSFENGKICFNAKFYHEIIFTPQHYETDFFELHNVLIGIGFHWEQKENQRFKGTLKFIIEDEKLTAINIIPVEEYLVSVISSEMSATSSLELLKAHAIASRSWLLAPLNLPIKGNFEDNASATLPLVGELEGAFIKWYERDAHTNFDVCADDHCQRYQGFARANTELVAQAVKLTHGQVIMHEGKICDARFSKCCGGISELFENCWQPEHYDYLLPVEDNENGNIRSTPMSEKEAENFIRDAKRSDFCNTNDTKILQQVLNSYDQETADFYRWKVTYTQREIADLLRQKSGFDFGEIIDIIPVERGNSGRLTKLKIVGTRRSIVVGKELEIRKWLSSSHLYSSAFVIEKSNFIARIPQQFTLFGAGWGHGVGLCQIGAAVMAEKGYFCHEILMHYFRNSEIKNIY